VVPSRHYHYLSGGTLAGITLKCRVLKKCVISFTCYHESSRTRRFIILRREWRRGFSFRFTVFLLKMLPFFLVYSIQVYGPTCVSELQVEFHIYAYLHCDTVFDGRRNRTPITAAARSKA
jgi:hypothetical protein